MVRLFGGVIILHLLSSFKRVCQYKNKKKVKKIQKCPTLGKTNQKTTLIVKYMFKVRIERTKVLRDDSIGFFGARIRNESNNLPDHETRMREHIKKVHTDTGPIPQCDCNICQGYLNSNTKGKSHEYTYNCHCYQCELERERRKAMNVYYQKKRA